MGSRVELTKALKREGVSPRAKDEGTFLILGVGSKGSQAEPSPGGGVAPRRRRHGWGRTPRTGGEHRRKKMGDRGAMRVEPRSRGGQRSEVRVLKKLGERGVSLKSR